MIAGDMVRYDILVAVFQFWLTFDNFMFYISTQIGHIRYILMSFQLTFSGIKFRKTVKEWNLTFTRK